MASATGATRGTAPGATALGKHSSSQEPSLDLASDLAAPTYAQSSEPEPKLEHDPIAHDPPAQVVRRVSRQPLALSLDGAGGALSVW